MHPDHATDLPVGSALGGHQNQPRPLCHTGFHGFRLDTTLELDLIATTQNQRT